MIYRGILRPSCFLSPDSADWFQDPKTSPEQWARAFHGAGHMARELVASASGAVTACLFSPQKHVPEYEVFMAMLRIATLLGPGVGYQCH